MEQLKKNFHYHDYAFYINTGMFDGVKSKLIPILEPEPTKKNYKKTVENKRKIFGNATSVLVYKTFSRSIAFANF